MLAALQYMGQLTFEAITVVEVVPHSYVLVDGNHRLCALWFMNGKQVRVLFCVNCNSL